MPDSEPHSPPADTVDSAERKATILIADDEPGIRIALKALLSREGHDIAFATDGLQALSEAVRLVPDLILLDVMMPGLDGFRVCQCLRADPKLAEVPIILITGLADRDSRLRGIEAGADDFVGKPFDAVELRARVRTTLRLNRYRKLSEQRMHLEQAYAELERAYNDTLEGWARALELRDAETEGHSRRVTRLTLRLARAMGVPDSELVHVHRGALLHDIGKMGVPDAILRKPGPLSAQERKIIERHPQYAHDMLLPIVYLRQALDIPYRHHERWDGTGYPIGLAREDIPLSARIFAAVDAWDAMLSDRPYRRGLPEEEVRLRLREGAGTQFDPAVIDALLEMTW